MGKLTFILGGARSGKSTVAERLAAQTGGRVVYIATAQALDDEMARRIQAHRGQRPPAWKTLEIPRDIARTLDRLQPQAGLILLDCLTLLVSNLLVDAGQDPENPDEDAAKALVAAEIDALLDAILAGEADWIVVSNEVGMGLVPPYPLGRLYRDLLGWANQQVAARADSVLFMIAGLPWRLAPMDD
jgi:adenosylcobinamide kinase/adenosylcobinamide-phosphate guanylyltransferase